MKRPSFPSRNHVRAAARSGGTSSTRWAAARDDAESERASEPARARRTRRIGEWWVRRWGTSTAAGKRQILRGACPRGSDSDRRARDDIAAQDDALHKGVRVAQGCDLRAELHIDVINSGLHRSLRSLEELGHVRRTVLRFSEARVHTNRLGDANMRDAGAVRPRKIVVQRVDGPLLDQRRT